MSLILLLPNVYNDKTGQNVSLSKLEAGFNGVIHDGKGSQAVQHYVDWFWDNKMEINDYGSKLQGVLTRYCIQNPDCPYDDLCDLNTAQINELDNKLNNSNYDLDLENLK